MNTIEIIGLCMIASGLFIAYHMYVAPTMDEKTGRVIKEGKKLSDLFKKKK
jgi:hypothetical protein